MMSEAKGNIYYGLHFYSGLAEYKEGDKSQRVYLTEDTLRNMDPTFAGRPVFVLHVDEIETDLNELRKEADGWVVDSFYNQADGKHWAKFIVVSEKGERAIANGMKLSNCYIPKTFGSSGTWNGITYDREITSGEYEHLAIVPDPRYEESVIMTPDEFKEYNESKIQELKKLANNKEGETKMKFSFFKRTKVENSTDLDAMCVVLPKSSKEVFLAKLINDADDSEMKKGEPQMAHPDHQVDVDGHKMTVNDLLGKYKDACGALHAMKKNEEEDAGMDPAEENAEDQDKEYSKEEPDMSGDDKEAEKSSMKLEKEEEKEVKDAKKQNAREKADRLKNADKNIHAPVAHVYLSDDQVSRGKSLYGSK